MNEKRIPRSNARVIGVPVMDIGNVREGRDNITTPSGRSNQCLNVLIRAGLSRTFHPPRRHNSGIPCESFVQFLSDPFFLSHSLRLARSSDSEDRPLFSPVLWSDILR